MSPTYIYTVTRFVEHAADPTATTAFVLKLYILSMDTAHTENNSACLALASLLRKSPRILCLVGAGLSAPSGLATWRGTSGLWRNADLKSLASPKAFAEDPVSVWSFYGERLLEAMAARPNDAHLALAALASWHDGWLTLSQNVDGRKPSYRCPVRLVR